MEQHQAEVIVLLMELRVRNKMKILFFIFIFFAKSVFANESCFNKVLSEFEDTPKPNMSVDPKKSTAAATVTSKPAAQAPAPVKKPVEPVPLAPVAQAPSPPAIAASGVSSEVTLPQSKYKGADTLEMMKPDGSVSKFKIEGSTVEPSGRVVHELSASTPNGQVFKKSFYEDELLAKGVKAKPPEPVVIAQKPLPTNAEWDELEKSMGVHRDASGQVVKTPAPVIAEPVVPVPQAAPIVQKPAPTYNVGDEISVPRRDGSVSAGKITSEPYVDPRDGFTKVNTSFVDPKTGSWAEKSVRVSAVEPAAPVRAVTPAEVVFEPPAPRPLRNEAANHIAAMNERDMALVNRNRPEALNGSGVSKAERMQEVTARDLGIADPNMKAAIDYKPVATSKDLNSTLKKVLPENSGVDVDLLRRTMSYNPSNGHLSTSDYANASKFVKAVEAKGGARALDKLNLSSAERDTLNRVMDRAPHYASYSDPAVRPLGRVSNAPQVSAITKTERDVVFTDSSGRQVAGRESFTQVGHDGETLSTVKYKKPDGLETSTTVPTHKVQSLAEAEKLNQFDARLTQRAERNRAAQIAATEKPDYVNPHGFSRAQVRAGEEIRLGVGNKPAEIVSVKPFKDSASGVQQVQVRYVKEIETRPGHPVRGKPVYEYESVNLTEIKPAPPKPARRFASVELEIPKAPQMSPEQAVRVQKLDQRLTENAEANTSKHLAEMNEPSYTNAHQVKKSDLQSGSQASVQIGAQKLEGEIISLPAKNPNTNVHEVQVRLQTGVETRPGHANQGKPTYEIHNVSVDQVTAVKAKPKLAATEIIPQKYKPINSEIRKPAGEAADPSTYSGKTFRQKADKEAADILIDRRVQVKTPAEAAAFKAQHDADLAVVNQALHTAPGPITRAVLEPGSAAFNPKLYYAQASKEYNSLVTIEKTLKERRAAGALLKDDLKDLHDVVAPEHRHMVQDASKLNATSSISKESEEIHFLGRYNNDGVRAGGARDKALGAVTDPAQKAELKKWMDDYDVAQARVQKQTLADNAVKEFDKTTRPMLEKAITGEMTPMSLTQFEKMTQQISQMQLPAEKKAAAEIALKKIRCSRPDWTSMKSYVSVGLDLKCH
jgi:hypothetical protein